MKLVLPNRDINDPAEAKEIGPVDLDLASSDFSAVIERAAADTSSLLDREQARTNLREAQAEADEQFKAIADAIQRRRGVAIGFQKPWAYKPKAKQAYALWRRVVPLFVEHPSYLDIGPTKLAQQINANEPNYTVTRDMMYDRLNDLAAKDLARLLAKLGVNLTLRRPVTIRSVQKQLIERREAAKDLPVEVLRCDVRIHGETAFVNGVPYQIQQGSTGKPRVKSKGEWLSLAAIRAFCRAAQ